MNLGNDANQMFRIYRNVRPVFNFNWYSSYGEKLSASQILDEEGNVMGQHRGLIHYTIGQRKGLGISSATPILVK